MEFEVKIPYCGICEKLDFEALKHPHRCCGDTYYRHVVFEGKLLHTENNIEHHGTDEDGEWNENYHEFDTKLVKVEGEIVE